MSNFLLEVLPILVAVIASLVGVIVAVSQFTSTSRLRKRAGFWGEQVQASELKRDHQVNQSLYREAMARLVALEAYPSSKLLWPMTLIVVATYGVGGAGYVAGGLVPDRLSIDNLQEGGIEVIFLVFSVLFLAMGTSSIASVVVRRRRLARQYLEGTRLSLEKPAIQQDAETVGLNMSCLGYLGLYAFSVGTCSIIAFVSFSSAAPRGALLSFMGGWGAGLWMLSFLLFFVGSFTVFSLFHQETRDWEHPRELSTQAARPKVDVGTKYLRRRQLRENKSLKRRTRQGTAPALVDSAP